LNTRQNFFYVIFILFFTQNRYISIFITFTTYIFSNNINPLYQKPSGSGGIDKASEKSAAGGDQWIRETPKRRVYENVF
jgi:hypothetical protein